MPGAKRKDRDSEATGTAAASASAMLGLGRPMSQFSERRALLSAAEEARLKERFHDFDTDGDGREHAPGTGRSRGAWQRASLSRGSGVFSTGSIKPNQTTRPPV